MKLISILILYFIAAIGQISSSTKALRPVVTFYRDRFGPGPQEAYDVWRVSLKLEEPVTAPHTFDISWNIRFSKAGKNHRLDFKDSINMVAGQSFRTKELYMPYGKDDVIRDVKLFREEQEIPAEVKIKR